MTITTRRGRKWSCYLADGGEQWVLVHLEVQGWHDLDFAERIFVYNYRVYDRYRRPVASLALLEDDSKRWRPDSFGYSLLGCDMRIDFPVVKLLEFPGQIDELQSHPNPFALVTAAHLLARQTRDNAHWRRRAKWQLTKRLCQRGWSRQRIIDLYCVIDWMMEEGLQEGRQEGQAALLSKRFGSLDETVHARLAQADADTLSAWALNFVDAATLDEVFQPQ
jgi:hypothetical protein